MTKAQLLRKGQINRAMEERKRRRDEQALRGKQARGCQHAKRHKRTSLSPPPQVLKNLSKHYTSI